MIQLNELRYIFHLVYNWVEVITGFKLTKSDIQQEAEEVLAGNNKPPNHILQLEDCIKFLGQHEGVATLFDIFTKQTRAEHQAELADAFKGDEVSSTRINAAEKAVSNLANAMADGKLDILKNVNLMQQLT